MGIKIIDDFEFIKVGSFCLSKTHLKYKYNSQQAETNLCIKLLYEGIQKLGESAYLIFVKNEPVYVGEYSYNFESRWLRKSKYSWHHKNNEIKDELINGNEVSIWVTRDPFVEIVKGHFVNISKSIEQEILKNQSMPWNHRGKLKKNESWVKDNCVKLSDIIKTKT